MNENNKMVAMTAEELAEYQAFKAAQEEKKREEEKAKAREDYRVLKEELVRSNFNRLAGISTTMREAKAEVLADFDALISMKTELYEVKEEQRSHTFMSDDGTVRITVGSYYNDNYQDSVNEGIALVKESINGLAKDEESKVLVDAVLKLLSKDSQGNIKASRVVQLTNMAEKISNKKFQEGVKIIREAYTPVLSKRYIRCECKGSNNEWLSVPLGLTEA